MSVFLRCSTDKHHKLCLSTERLSLSCREVHLCTCPWGGVRGLGGDSWAHREMVQCPERQRWCLPGEYAAQEHNYSLNLFLTKEKKAKFSLNMEIFWFLYPLMTIKWSSFGCGEKKTFGGVTSGFGKRWLTFLTILPFSDYFQTTNQSISSNINTNCSPKNNIYSVYYEW